MQYNLKMSLYERDKIDDVLKQDLKRFNDENRRTNFNDETHFRVRYQ
jgi:hypothetical protein